MSAISEKQRMRDALQLTEGNLGSLIASRANMGQNPDNNVMQRAMTNWYNVVRKALGYNAPAHECICPNCGLRHGGRKSPAGDF